MTASSKTGPQSEHATRAADPSRNALCPCGSGKKYKKCCGAPAGQPTSPGPVAASSGPQAARALFQRGVQLLRSGQVAAAIPVLLGCIKADSAYFDGYHALGSALLQSGRFAEASAILLQAVTLRPDSVAANLDLGAAFDHQNLHEQAIETYRRALALSPRLGDVQLRLGQLYAMYSRMEEASACLHRAADAKPSTAQARLYRSDAELLRGNMPEAEQWARKAIALEPANSAAHGALGGVLYNQGRFDAAVPSFEAALRLNPKSAKCWDGLAHCRKYSAADNAILARMQAVLGRSDLNDGERMTIQFAMGKVLDDCGDYAQAMEQFDAANRLRAKDLHFDRAGMAALIDQNIRVFTPEFMARHAAAGTQDATPLFIVGMYRSGTTLTEQIVSSHRGIVAGGELTVWAPMDLEVDAPLGGLNPERTQAAVAKYLSALRRIGGGAGRVTDKLPTNFFRLGAIHALMPKARIIHCRRDPIDTCLSLYSTHFNTRIAFAARKDDLVFYYQQYARMMEHWRTVLPADVFLEVEYERLIADREAETRRLIAFTGLEWDDACLRPEQNKRPIGTSSAWQARQPVYATSMQRWRRYEPWLGELRQLL